MLYTSLREKAPLFEIRGFLSPNRSAGDTLRCAVIAESPAERSPRELNGAEEGGEMRRVQHDTHWTAHTPTCQCTAAQARRAVFFEYE